MKSARSSLGWLLTAFVILLLIVLDAPNQMLSRIAYAVQLGRSQADMEVLAGVEDVGRAFRMVARVARPGVVHIQVRPSGDDVAAMQRRIIELSREIDELLNNMPPEDDATFGPSVRRLAELRAERFELLGRMQASSGSGIIFDAEGHVLTNNHVVDDPGQIMVRLADDREYTAVLVGRDPQTDLALLRIPEREIQPLRFGDSDKIEVGDWVLAVGAPFGLDYTVTHGILSARGRTNIQTGRGVLYQDFLQTDAAINPGNSGGPLLNIRGEVVGVNTAIATDQTGVNAGVAFAIPANLAGKIALRLKSEGTVVRGWLGVQMLGMERADRELFGLSPQEGVMVRAVLPGSPAESAGLQPEDVVLRINDEPVAAPDKMLAIIGDVLPGETAEFQILRRNETLSFHVKLEERTFDRLDTRATLDRSSVELAGLGVFVQTQMPSESRRLPADLSSGGARVVRFPSRLQFRLGDVIIELNDQRVRTAGELAERLSAASAGKLRFTVMGTDGERRIVEIARDD